jgi:hypothetical protein
MTRETLSDRLCEQFGDRSMHAYAANLTKAQLERIFDHQRWLTTDGRFGSRLVLAHRAYDNVDLDAVDLSRAVLSHLDFGHFVRGGQ